MRICVSFLWTAHARNYWPIQKIIWNINSYDSEIYPVSSNSSAKDKRGGRNLTTKLSRSRCSQCCRFLHPCYSWLPYICSPPSFIFIPWSTYVSRLSLGAAQWVSINFLLQRRRQRKGHFGIVCSSFAACRHSGSCPTIIGISIS